MTSNDYKRLLTEIYSIHNPDKLKDIPLLLKKYKGQEQQLIVEVKSKYCIDVGKDKQDVLDIRIDAKKVVTKQLPKKIYPILIGVLIILVVIALFLFHDNKQCEVLPFENSTKEVLFELNARKERKPILNALRIPVQNELKQNVKFIVYSIKICNRYAVVLAKPVQQSGIPVDYTNTKYNQYIIDGAFDDGVQALLKYENGDWIIVEYVIGATDSRIIEWKSENELNGCS